VQRADTFDWLIFTSANGVRIFFDRLYEIGADVRVWHRARLAAIGPQTARELGRRGLRVDLVPDEYRAEGVIEALEQAGVKGRRVLLPRAAGARDILPRRLSQLGATVEEIVTYESVHPHVGVAELRAQLAAGEVDAVTFTSSSTVHNFAASIGDDLVDLMARATVACIGPITAETAADYGLRVDIQPATYTIPAFAEAIAGYFAGRSRRRRDYEPDTASS
jgi:uroporphyrinogen III methyltransferase/synthase